jgi:Tol biopolymer transport system component/C-terminal processing protease CtpA/Prc
MFVKKLRAWACCLFIIAPLALAAASPGAPTKAQDEQPVVTYLSQPAISPDLSEIAFVSGGDIWTVPASGGDAHLLVSNPATESRPLYSPDGKRLAFISTRTGNGDIYVLDLGTGALKRITFDDGFDQLDAWSRDGRWLYFSSTSHDISGMNDIYRVSAQGGTPMPVSDDRYTNEFFGAPSPDGHQLALTARGIASSQWWRKGHSHLDESEIWLMRDGESRTYQRITDGGAKEMWPMWDQQGKSVFYVSDRSGPQNIWVIQPGGVPRRVTDFRDGRVLWPCISYDGSTIVFERDFAIWKLETATGKVSRVPIRLRGAAAGPLSTHLTLTGGFEELALSPDGKKLALIVHGEVFAASAKEGGDATRVTSTAGRESQITWAPDSRRLAYVSDRDAAPHIYIYDFKTASETQLTAGGAGDSSPTFSPDGKKLAFVRDGKELRVLDIDSKQEQVLAGGRFSRAPFIQARAVAWSPDGKWLAYVSASGRMFRNVSVVPAAGGDSRQISFLANDASNTISWSPDGSFILFDTGQRTETHGVARVDLVPRVPTFRENQFRDLFREESPRTTPPPVEPKPESYPGQPPETATDQKAPARKPVEINFDEIRRRLSLLPVGVDTSGQTISADGKFVLLNATAAGEQNLYVFPLEDQPRERPVSRQLTSTPGPKSSARFSPDGKEVLYLEQGRVFSMPIDTRQPKPIAITAEMDVDFSAEKMEVFREGWTYLRDNFFDPNFNGVDWNRVRGIYEPLVAGARTQDEVSQLLQLMVGELNASHSGATPPRQSFQRTTGRTGLSFDRAEYESSGRLRITEVVPLGPAAVQGKIKPGNYLMAVDGATTGAQTNLDEMLDHKIGRLVTLTVADSSDGAGRREVNVRPVDQTTIKGLMYRNWVETNREYVGRISNGRLGYAHMFDMFEGSLAQLYADLDEQNVSREGVIIDVRNNNGGFVNVYAIDVLARRSYLNMGVRGMGEAPARTILGQRALERPTILVTNQHSFSDAEDFTEGYRALKLGRVVGEPTAGSIIYTSNVDLIDGSSIRIPFMKVTAADGSPMEMHPRPVDVPVTRPIGESLSGRDSQLESAVKQLLDELDHREGSRARK